MYLSKNNIFFYWKKTTKGASPLYSLLLKATALNKYNILYNRLICQVECFLLMIAK